VDAVFRRIEGVQNVVVGYAGGHTEEPTYEAVCSGTTGHIEVAEITYDENLVSLESLVDTFLRMHDPTSLNKQGSDVGTQYRSAIFWTGETQRDRIVEHLEKKQREYAKPFVTEVRALENFFKAEEYHQNYFEKNPDQAYCQAVIVPKLIKAL
jgi:peptide-methionine (S)-S-oxide reductase